jgi:protein PsiE
MFSRIESFIKERLLNDPVFNNGLHWTTIVSEKLLLGIIGALTMVAAAAELRALWHAQSVGLTDLFLFFIYAEIVGMVGAFYASRRIPVTLPIIIAITALCRTIIGQGKEAEPMMLLAAAGAILILAGSAYVMSLKDKLSMEKAALRAEASQKKQFDKSDGV